MKLQRISSAVAYALKSFETNRQPVQYLVLAGDLMLALEPQRSLMGCKAHFEKPSIESVGAFTMSLVIQLKGDSEMCLMIREQSWKCGRRYTVTLNR